MLNLSLSLSLSRRTPTSSFILEVVIFLMEICIRAGATAREYCGGTGAFIEQLQSHVSIHFFRLFTHSKVLSFYQVKEIGGGSVD